MIEINSILLDNFSQVLTGQLKNPVLTAALLNHIYSIQSVNVNLLLRVIFLCLIVCWGP